MGFPRQPRETGGEYCSHGAPRFERHQNPFGVFRRVRGGGRLGLRLASPLIRLHLTPWFDMWPWTTLPDVTTTFEEVMDGDRCGFWSADN